MTIGKCHTCKFWKLQPQGEDGRSLGLGKCMNVPLFYDATDWVPGAEDGEDRQLIDSFKDKKAFAQDASGYQAFLLTMPDFGCVSRVPLN